jgi:hypothetical protein
MASAWGFFLMPACAMVTGAVVASTSAKSAPDDGALVRDFMVILGILLLLVFGIGRLEFVRMRTDPQFRLQTQLAAHPVYAALKRSPEDQKALHDFLMGQSAQGKSLPEAFLQARPLLTKLATERLGEADQDAVIGWGQLTVDTLKELANRDPMLCYQAMALQPLDARTLADGFSPGNTQVFEQAVIDVYASHEKAKRQREEGVHVDFNTAAREYAAIKEGIANRFGEPVAKLLSKKAFPSEPEQPAAQLCAARIAQLDAFLDRSPAMARSLIGAVLR